MTGVLAENGEHIQTGGHQRDPFGERPDGDRGRDRNDAVTSQGINNHRKIRELYTSKENNSVPITEPKEMKNYELLEKKFRVILLKKLKASE